LHAQKVVAFPGIEIEEAAAIIDKSIRERSRNDGLLHSKSAARINPILDLGGRLQRGVIAVRQEPPTSFANLSPHENKPLQIPQKRDAVNVDGGGRYSFEPDFT